MIGSTGILLRAGAPALTVAGWIGDALGFALSRQPNRRIVLTGPAGAAELVLDVTPGFLDGLRSSRSRPELDQLLNMRESFFTRKFFPDFCLRCRRRIRTKYRDADNQE